MNKNLEYIGGEPFNGRHENAHFWRWLISRLTPGPEWVPPREEPGVETDSRSRSPRHDACVGGNRLAGGSWLLGWGYFDPPHPLVATIAFVLGVVLLRKVRCAWPAASRICRCALALLLPALWLWTWPAKLIPLALALGTADQDAGSGSQAGRGQLARALAVSGAVLLAQGVTMQAYATCTARNHELPPLLAHLLGLVPRWLGLDSAVDGGWIAIRGHTRFTVSRPLGSCCWTRPVCCFWWAAWSCWPGRVAGRRRGGGWISLDSGCSPPAGHRARVGPAPRGLVAGDLAAAGSYERMRLPNPIRRWCSSIAGFIWDCWPGRCCWPSGCCRSLPGVRGMPSGAPAAARPRPPAGPRLLTAMGVALLVFVAVWSPVGSRKTGRITVVERHSTWEPTIEPYGTTVYGEAGSYNYAAAYAYCGQYFTMSRLLEQDAIDDAALGGLCRADHQDTHGPLRVGGSRGGPTLVEQGGSLLLIGDHTNVFNMNTYLNDIARRFGFSFRNDLLFRVGDPYRQHYRRPWLAHPAVQHVPPMDFAVSCSIDPGWSLGRMVIRSEGLYNLPPAYHESNYHPQAEYRPHMQYGAWCQMWATSYGRGRVLAFADSTLFSNFCVFQPGKAELLRGMLDWLDRTSVWDRAYLTAGCPAPAAAGRTVAGRRSVVLQSRQYRGNWLIAAQCRLATGTLTGQGLVAWQRQAMPTPPLQRPLPHVVIDRNISQVPLFTGCLRR